MVSRKTDHRYDSVYIDAHNVLHRAANAMPVLYNRDGLDIAPLQALASQLMHWSSTYGALVMDGKHPFRELIDSDYKRERHEASAQAMAQYNDAVAAAISQATDHRQQLVQTTRSMGFTDMAEGLESDLDEPAFGSFANKPPAWARVNVAAAESLARALGWPVVRDDDFEADDLLYSLALDDLERGLRVAVVSDDKDLAALMPAGAHLYAGMEQLTLETMEKRIGDAKRVAAIQAFAGDSTDGYSGVPGFGVIKTLKLLDGLEGSAGSVVERGLGRAEQQTAAIRRALVDNLGMARRSLSLSTLHRVPLPQQVRGTPSDADIAYVRSLGLKKASTMLEERTANYSLFE